MKSSVLILLAAAFISTAVAKCPNSCSGKGRCGEDDLCTCYPGYTGRDCSGRTCQYGRAWGDAPHSRRTGGDAQNSEVTGNAHHYAECSNAGECDRKTGECTCNDGFSGDGCRYSTCPNDCSGHGTCEYSSEVTTEGHFFETTARTSTHIRANNDRQYNLWDNKATRYCKCDPYYYGNDCSLRMCPRGNDPLTKMVPNMLGANIEERNEVQTVTISAANTYANNKGVYVGLAGSFTLTYTDAYGQPWTTRPIRVKTKLTGDKLSFLASAPTTITDTGARLNLFQRHDTVKFSSSSTLAVVKEATPTTITTQGAVGSSDVAGASGNYIVLANPDTGEVGVQRALMELPNQVIPSIQVDETITPTSNVFRITFSDAANSGDQHMLQCKVDACTHDGCQPRSDGVKGLFQVSSAVASSSFTTTIAEAATGDFTNIPSSFSDLTAVTTAAATLVVKSFSGTNSGDTLTRTAGDTLAGFGDLSGEAGLNFLFFNTFSGDDLGQSTAIVAGTVTDDNTKGVANTKVTFADDGHDLGVGDTVQIAHSSTYIVKVVEVASAVVTFDRDMGTTAENDVLYFTKVTASPCTVEETTKGTSELLECSGRGLCDDSTGTCECFEGYTDEDCSKQTVLF